MGSGCTILQLNIKLLSVTKVLIYGSTRLTEDVVSLLISTNKYELVGYIPSSNPFIRGDLHRYLDELPLGYDDYDIALSIQYDKKIINLRACFNLHTGLLPTYAGCDTLYHAIKNGEREQGLTFHKIALGFDDGPIISKITFPIFPVDDVVSLYGTMLDIAPRFTETCIDMVRSIAPGQIDQCASYRPNIYKRGMIAPEDKDTYLKNGQRLVEIYGRD